MPEETRSLMDQNRTRTSLLQHVRDVGDELRWMEFYDTYSDLIFYTARKAGFQPAEAEDLAQEVFIELVRRMPRFEYDRTQGSFRGWLLRLVSWRIKDHHRRHSRHPDRTDIYQPDPQESEFADSLVEPKLEEYWNGAWRKAVVQRALANLQKTSKLSERHGQILVLLLVRGLRPAETADRLGIKRGLVDTVYSRNRPQLEQEICRLRDEPI